MRRRILDLFKSMFKGQKAKKNKTRQTKVETIEKTNIFQSRKKPPSKWCITHNRLQAEKSNKVQKRRKANKVARRQRKINRAA